MARCVLPMVFGQGLDLEIDIFQSLLHLFLLLIGQGNILRYASGEKKRRVDSLGIQR